MNKIIMRHLRVYVCMYADPETQTEMSGHILEEDFNVTVTTKVTRK